MIALVLVTFVYVCRRHMCKRGDRRVDQISPQCRQSLNYVCVRDVNVWVCVGVILPE